MVSSKNKLTCLNGVITPEAVNRLEDELGRIFTVAKTHHYKQGQKYGHLASAIPKPNTGLSLEKRHGPTPYLETQAHTPCKHSLSEMQLHYKSSMWQST
jgi:hypothetical protein